MGRVREKREKVYRGGLELTKESVSAASSRDRGEPVAMVSNVLLSREVEISPASVTNTQREGEDTVRGTLPSEERNAVCGRRSHNWS